jgi:hypothetical protein
MKATQQYNDESIKKFVNQILVERFPNDRFRHQINSDDPQKLNFCCPYCVDSDRDSSKKRGNLYLKTQSYKCFNDGCQIWVPLNKFVSNFALKYSIEIPKIQPSIIKRVKVGPKKGEIIESIVNPKVRNSLIDFLELKNRFFLKPCKDAPEDSPIKKYVESRKIVNLPAFEQTCYYDSNQDKIFIFNLDIRSGKVLGLSVRRISDLSPGPKYNIKNYSEFKKTGLVSNIDDEIIQKIDAINNYYNILNVNFSEPIIVTEGQIDSMFLRNSISTTGVTKSKAILESILSKKSSKILFDNDKAGKSEEIKLIQLGYQVFLWSKLIADLKLKYSNSLSEIIKIKDINDLYLFYSSREDLSFDQFNDLLEDYFSNSIYDLYLI